MSRMFVLSHKLTFAQCFASSVQAQFNQDVEQGDQVECVLRHVISTLIANTARIFCCFSPLRFHAKKTNHDRTNQQSHLIEQSNHHQPSRSFLFSFVVVHHIQAMLEAFWFCLDLFWFLPQQFRFLTFFFFLLFHVSSAFLAVVELLFHILTCWRSVEWTANDSKAGF